MDNNQSRIQMNGDQMQMNSVLLQLTAAITSLDQTQREMSSQKQLDARLQGAMSTFGPDNSYAVGKVYQQEQMNIFTQQIAPVAQALQQIQQNLAMMQQQQQQNQQLLDVYKQQTTGTMSANPLNLQDVFNQGNMFRQNYEMPNIGLASTGSPLMEDYMAKAKLPLSLRPVIAEEHWYGDTYRPAKSTEMSYFNVDAAIENAGRKLQDQINSGTATVQKVQDYYNFNRDMFRESQAAYANYSVANQLGVPGGSISRNEFDVGIMPALNQMSNTMGTDISGSIDVLRKMKEINAVATEINSGDATKTIIGIDQAMNVVKVLSRLMNSSDIQAITNMAGNVSAYGGGDFGAGFSAITQSSAGNPRGIADRWRDVMSATQDPFGPAMFGTNRAGIEMGLFHQMSGKIATDFGSPSESFYLGGAGGISNSVSSMVGSMINSPILQASVAGGGDILTGSDRLTDEMMKDPTSFFLKQRSKQFALRNQMGGSTGYDYMLGKNMDFYKKILPGMSEDEVMLAMAGGDPNKVDALKQYKKADRAQNMAISDDLDSLRPLWSSYAGTLTTNQDILVSAQGKVASQKDAYLQRIANENGGFLGGASNAWSDWRDEGTGAVGYAEWLTTGMGGKSGIVGGVLAAGLELAKGGNEKVKSKFTGAIADVSLDQFKSNEFVRTAGTSYHAVGGVSGVATVIDAESTNMEILFSTIFGSQDAQDIAAQVLERYSKAGGIQEEEVRNMLYKMENKARGEISGENRKKYINFVSSATMAAIKNIAAKVVSDDNPILQVIKISLGDKNALENDPDKYTTNLINQALIAGGATNKDLESYNASTFKTRKDARKTANTWGELVGGVIGTVGGTALGGFAGAIGGGMAGAALGAEIAEAGVDLVNTVFNGPDLNVEQLTTFFNESGRTGADTEIETAYRMLAAIINEQGNWAGYNDDETNVRPYTLDTMVAMAIQIQAVVNKTKGKASDKRKITISTQDTANIAEATFQLKKEKISKEGQARFKEVLLTVAGMWTADKSSIPTLVAYMKSSDIRNYFKTVTDGVTFGEGKYKDVFKGLVGATSGKTTAELIGMGATLSPIAHSAEDFAKLAQTEGVLTTFKEKGMEFVVNEASKTDKTAKTKFDNMASGLDAFIKNNDPKALDTLRSAFSADQAFAKKLLGAYFDPADADMFEQLLLNGKDSKEDRAKMFRMLSGKQKVHQAEEIAERADAAKISHVIKQVLEQLSGDPNIRNKMSQLGLAR